MKASIRSKWLLLHINSSDFEDGSLGSQNAPEFFGDPMACVNSDVVSHAFKDGTDDFNMRLLPNQIAEPDLDHIYQDVSQLQNATISLALPSCPKPENDDFVFGTVETPGIYTLQPCECFGAAHAAAAPVDEASDAAVPCNQDGYFNNGSAPRPKHTLAIAEIICQRCSRSRGFVSAFITSHDRWNLGRIERGVATTKFEENPPHRELTHRQT